MLEIEIKILKMKNSLNELISRMDTSEEILNNLKIGQ